MYSKGAVLLKRYELLEMLGRGGFSQVWKAKDNLSETLVAIKFFIKQDESGVALCRQEFQRTFDLTQDNIVRTIHFDVIEGTPLLIMSFCRNGNLSEKAGLLSEMEIAEIVTQICNALIYIHSKSPVVVHNDIKPDNFLVDADRYLLCDFGISQRLQFKLTQTLGYEEGVLHQTIPSGITPVAYRSPELFDTKDRSRSEPSPMSDMWSFGASIYLLATGEPPFQGGGGLTQYVTLKNTTNISTYDILLQHSTKFSEDFYDVIIKCLALDPLERPSAQQLKLWAENYLKTGQKWFGEEERKSIKSINNPIVSTPKQAEEDGVISFINYIRDKNRFKYFVFGLLSFIFLYIGIPFGIGNFYETKGDEFARQLKYKDANDAYQQATRFYGVSSDVDFFTKTRTAKFLSQYDSIFNANEGLLGVSKTINNKIRWNYFDIKESRDKFSWSYAYISKFEKGRAMVIMAKDTTMLYLHSTDVNVDSVPDSIKLPLLRKLNFQKTK